MVQNEFTTLWISANMDTSVRQRREPGQTPVSIPPLKETSIPSLFNSNHCALCLPETITIQSNTNYFPHSIRSGPSSQFRGASKGQKTKVLKILLLGIFAVKNDALAVCCVLFTLNCRHVFFSLYQPVTKNQIRKTSKGQETKVLKILLLGIFAVKNDALAVHCHLCGLKLNFLTLLSCIYHLVSGA